jgi:hypothetical protein
MNEKCDVTKQNMCHTELFFWSNNRYSKADDVTKVEPNKEHLVSHIFELAMVVVIGTDCIGSCKSNFHTIIAVTAPKYIFNVR